MTRLLRGRPVLGPLALAIALLAVLGHVCVLPHEAHAAGAESAHGHDSHDSQHDALHAASCEAVSSTATSSVPAAAGGSVTVVAANAPADGLIHASRRPAVATSPPLFLLHAALRI